MKAVSQIDFIVAIGIFLIVMAFVVSYMTDFITPLRDVSNSANIRQRSFVLMSEIESEQSVLSLYTTAFRVKIKLENSGEFLINKSHPITDLAKEAVKLNTSKINFSKIDRFSFAIYNESMDYLDYYIAGDLIVFNSSIDAWETKYFYVYFDDDSSFSDNTVEMNASNRLNEIVYPVEEITVLQQKKLQLLQASSYEYLRSIANGDFAIIVDGEDGSRTLIGEEPPSRKDLTVLEKNVVMQDAGAKIMKGVVRVYAW